jgi:DNA-binding transcriptional LysR family regulator
MFIGQLQCLVALEKERHFGRAAEACHVSQPALSGAIRSIEQELGVTIVQRGRRFEGFTADGERVLAWGKRALAEVDGLRQEARTVRGDPVGTLRLGAIPTTLPVLPLLTEASLLQFPRMRLEIHTLTAAEILRRIAEFQLDLGVSYLKVERAEEFHTIPLFEERYALVARANAFAGRENVSWSEIASLPLVLLTSNMQSRRGMNAAFDAAGIEIAPRVETDSIMTLYAHIRSSGLYGILPHSVLCLLEMRQELTVVPIVPELRREIGLFSLKREIHPALVAAALSTLQHVDVQARIDGLLAGR